MEFKLILDQSSEETIVATVHKRTSLVDEIERLVMAYDGRAPMTGYAGSDIARLNYAEIECITVISSKTYAIDLNGARYQIKKRLYEVEQLLPSRFIRINKSSLANQSRIQKFTVGINGAVDVIFKSGYKEYVSRRCFSSIKRRLAL